MGSLEHEALTEKIIAGAIKVHAALGPGLLESVYESCLARELTQMGIRFRRQADVPVVYDNQKLDCAFRADLIVEELVIVEIKAIDKLIPIHEAQLKTYIRLSGVRVGLLLNFNQLRVTSGLIRRII